MSPQDTDERFEKAHTVPRAKRSRAKIALVLGGGGLKGFAHIGVLSRAPGARHRPDGGRGHEHRRADRRGVRAAECRSPRWPTARVALKRRDLFRLESNGDAARAAALALDLPRGAAPAVVESRGDPEAVRPAEEDAVSSTPSTPARHPRSCGDCPGLRDVSVVDAVYASCALPGFLSARQYRSDGAA